MPKEACELVEQLINAHQINTQDPEVYISRVVTLGGGMPGEPVRLMRYVSAEAIVHNQQAGIGYAQDFAQHEEREIALVPILLVIGGAGMVIRTLGLARGEIDMYVSGAILVVVFVIVSPWLRKAMAAR